MGSTKIESQTSSQATPTPEETELNQRNLRIAKATEAGETQAQLSGLNLVNQLLMGQIPGGMYQQMAGGIDSQALAGQATQMMRSGRTGMQGQGLANSGEADRAISKDIAGNLLFPAQQFNIGALQNLMNLALTGQAQVQQPIQSNVNNLSSSLAGLRTTTGTQSQTSNPFLSSFYSSMGQGLGSSAASGVSGGVGSFLKTGMLW